MLHEHTSSCKKGWLLLIFTSIFLDFITCILSALKTLTINSAMKNKQNKLNKLRRHRRENLLFEALSNRPYVTTVFVFCTRGNNGH